MKKIKSLSFGIVLAGALFFSTPSNARALTFAYIFENGCIGTHTYHSFLGFQWETYEVIAC